MSTIKRKSYNTVNTRNTKLLKTYNKLKAKSYTRNPTNYILQITSRNPTTYTQRNTKNYSQTIYTNRTSTIDLFEVTRSDLLCFTLFIDMVHDFIDQADRTGKSAIEKQILTTESDSLKFIRDLYNSVFGEKMCHLLNNFYMQHKNNNINKFIKLAQDEIYKRLHQSGKFFTILADGTVLKLGKKQSIVERNKIFSNFNQNKQENTFYSNGNAKYLKSKLNLGFSDLAEYGQPLTYAERTFDKLTHDIDDTINKKNILIVEDFHKHGHSIGPLYNLMSREQYGSYEINKSVKPINSISRLYNESTNRLPVLEQNTYKDLHFKLGQFIDVKIYYSGVNIESTLENTVRKLFFSKYSKKYNKQPYIPMIDFHLLSVDQNEKIERKETKKIFFRFMSAFFESQLGEFRKQQQIDITSLKNNSKIVNIFIKTKSDTISKTAFLNFLSLNTANAVDNGLKAFVDHFRVKKYIIDENLEKLYYMNSFKILQHLVNPTNTSNRSSYMMSDLEAYIPEFVKKTKNQNVHIDINLRGFDGSIHKFTKNKSEHFSVEKTAEQIRKILASNIKDKNKRVFCELFSKTCGDLSKIVTTLINDEVIDVNSGMVSTKKGLQLKSFKTKYYAYYLTSDINASLLSLVCNNKTIFTSSLKDTYFGKNKKASQTKGYNKHMPFALIGPYGRIMKKA